MWYNKGRDYIGGNYMTANHSPNPNSNTNNSSNSSNFRRQKNLEETKKRAAQQIEEMIWGNIEKYYLLEEKDISPEEITILTGYVSHELDNSSTVIIGRLGKEYIERYKEFCEKKELPLLDGELVFARYKERAFREEWFVVKWTEDKRAPETVDELLLKR